MKNLLKLFSILQLTKEQPLTGYVLGGLKSSELPSLAEHHFTTALTGYFLTHRILDEGGDIDQNKVVVMSLIHDLSELFGGDVAGPLNRKYPDLREYKDKIGQRAIDLLCEYMDQASHDEFKTFWDELSDGKTDESIVVKIVDQMDHQLFLEHHNFKGKYDPGYTDYRPSFINDHVFTLTSKISDSVTKDVMNDFLKTFKDQFFNKGFQAMNIMMED